MAKKLNEAIINAALTYDESLTDYLDAPSCAEYADLEAKFIAHHEAGAVTPHMAMYAMTHFTMLKVRGYAVFSAMYGRYEDELKTAYRRLGEGVIRTKYSAWQAEIEKTAAQTGLKPPLLSHYKWLPENDLTISPADMIVNDLARKNGGTDSGRRVPDSPFDRVYLLDFGRDELDAAIYNATSHIEDALNKPEWCAEARRRLIGRRWKIVAESEKTDNSSSVPPVPVCATGGAIPDVLSTFYAPGALSMLQIRDYKPLPKHGKVPPTFKGQYTHPDESKKNEDVTVTVRDADMRGITSLPITALALMLYGLNKLTGATKWRETRPGDNGYIAVDQCRAFIPYAEYMKLRDLKDRKQAVQSMERDAYALMCAHVQMRSMLIVNGDKSAGQKRICKNLETNTSILAGYTHVRGGGLWLTFAPDFVEAVANSFLLYLPSAIWKVDFRRHASAFGLGVNLWRTLTMPGPNEDSPTGVRILSIDTLAEYCTAVPLLSEWDAVPPSVKNNAGRTFWRPIEADLGILADIGLIDWEFCDSNGVPLSDEEKERMTGWRQIRGQNVRVSMREGYRQEFLQSLDGRARDESKPKGRRRRKGHN